MLAQHYQYYCDIICVPRIYSNTCQVGTSYKWHHMFHVTPTALNQAGRHMEDSIMATLLLEILVKHNLVRVSQFTPYHWSRVITDLLQLYILVPETSLVPQSLKVFLPLFYPWRHSSEKSSLCLHNCILEWTYWCANLLSVRLLTLTAMVDYFAAKVDQYLLNWGH